MALLQIRDITKTFNHEPAVDHVSLDLEQGNILCLLGPSGCGKTTLLRIIAGLEPPDSGSVYFDGRNMAGVEPHCRNFGMMFQEFALFPHKDVVGNITFGLRMQKRPEPEILSRTKEMLSLVGLEGYDRRNVSELSGGERQRVALARSLAPHPRLLMLDEPMGSLDKTLRERLLLEVRYILKTVGVTTIFVTHDHTEAFAIADVVAVMNRGRIDQTDAPETIYSHPANARVARFLGFTNLVAGIVLQDGTIDTALGILRVTGTNQTPGTRVTVLIRPDGVRLSSTAQPKGQSVITGMVKNCLFMGKTYQVELLTHDGTTLFFDLPCESGGMDTNRHIELVLSPGACVVMPGE